MERSRVGARSNDSANLIDSEVLQGSTDDIPSQEQEELSTREVLQRLHDAWINEKFAPELLDPQIEVVDCLLEQIAHIEDKISKERLRNGSDPKIKFAASVYKMEIGRIRFTISSYLRTRLEKIQSFIFHLLGLEEKAQESDTLEENGMYTRMTANELKFAKQYRADIAEVYKKLALDHMPGAFKEFVPLASSNESMNSSSLAKTKKN